MMKTVGLSSGVEGQLVAVVMKETVVKMAVDEYYRERKGPMKYKDGSEEGLKDALSAELHINLQSPARRAPRYQLRRYVWEEM